MRNLAVQQLLEIQQEAPLTVDRSLFAAAAHAQ
jgi:hypothetical protein